MNAIQTRAGFAYSRPKIFYFRITQPFLSFCKINSASEYAPDGVDICLFSEHEKAR